MGEEEKKAEEKKEEAKKPQEEKKEKKEEEKKEAEKKETDGEKKDEKKDPLPPPEEFVYKVYMHCEGCARKVKRSLKGFEGVENVVTDCKTHTVVVKGKTADPLKVLERIQRKNHRKVELLTPLPPKPPAEDVKKEEKEKPKPEEKKEEPVIVVVLKVHMHCEACAQEIRKRIQKMKGVESADPDLKSSQVTVKGVFDPPKLVEYIYKRTGKHAVIIKQEPEKKEEEKPKEEKKSETAEKGGEGEKAKKEGEDGKGEDGPKIEVTKNEYYYYYPKYPTEYIYHPQIFSDENPNACSVM